MCSGAFGIFSLIHEMSIRRRAACRGLPDLAHDAAGDVVAGEELGRTPRVLVALGISPALFRIVRGLAAVVVGDVVEHEAAALAVAEDPAFTAALGDENALDARRPDHAGRVELHELHVDEIGAGVIRERVAVAGAFPAVAGDAVGAADAAGGEDDCPGAEHLEAARSRS